MKYLFSAAICAAFIGAPTLAQDSVTEPSEPTEPVAAEPSPETPAPTVAEGVEGGESGETIVAVHKDWQIRCLPQNANCYMYQLAVDARDVPVAEMSVVAVKQDNEVVAGFTIMSPLQTYLPAGIQVQIDNGNLQRYQFEFCAPQGCIARFGVSDNGLNQFRAGNKVRLTVVSAETRDAPVILDVSLLGFTAAMTELNTLQ